LAPPLRRGRLAWRPAPPEIERARRLV